MDTCRFARIVVVAVLASLAATSVRGQSARDTLDILFVGNSYTYVNNLPGMIEEISSALDGPVLHGSAHTHGGYTLRRHIEDGHVASLLSGVPATGGSWDWVVLQEQSTLGTTYDPDSGKLGKADAFRAAAAELVAMVKAVGARPALYMTWAKEAFPSQAITLSETYRSAGAELGAEVLMVGDAWAAVRRVRPEFVLHLSDGSHPNAAGSYLAACVIYAMLTGRSPVGAPRELSGQPWNWEGPVPSSLPTVLVSLSASDAEFLQGIAWEVVAAQRDSGK